MSLLAACAAGSDSDRGDVASSPAAPAVVSQAQALLAGLGYEPGAVDGIEGPRTAEAVRAFQTAAGLALDGRVSESLVARLQAERQVRLVAQAQRRLAALGYDPGPVDGKAGARTRDAVVAFQRAQDLPPDGQVTAELVERLATVGDEATAEPSKRVAAPDPQTPILRPGDRILLSYQSTTSEPAETRIGPDGRLALPEVGSVQAAGLDLKQLHDQVTVKLIESYLGKLDVGVRLVAADETAGTADPRARVLSPGDRISVSTAAEDASPAELEIDPDGWLLLPEVGRFRAAGLGLTELRDDITVKLLETYMGNLKVKVRLAEVHGPSRSAE